MWWRSLTPARLARGLNLPHLTRVPAWTTVRPPRSPCSGNARAHMSVTSAELRRTLPTRAFFAGAGVTRKPKSSMTDHDDVQSLVAQLDAHFPASKWMPSPLYSADPEKLTHERYVHTLDNYTIVIDGDIRLLNEYVGDVQPLAQKCVDFAAMPPDARLKPLIATVCGPGGGKTRMLEELRLALLQRKERDVLPLAFTFNAHMQLSSSEYHGVHAYLQGAVPEVRYAFAVMKRLLGVFYGSGGVHCRLAHGPDGEVLQLQSRHSVSSARLAPNLLRATVIHIFRALNRQRALNKQPKVTTVVVMQDESLTVDLAFSRKTASILRAALLEEKLDPELNVALVVTALVPSVVQDQVRAGRAVEPVVLPRLSADDVLRRWWGIRGPGPAPPLARVVAAAVKDLPRQVEVFNDEIQKMKLAEPGAKWDAAAVRRVFDKSNYWLRSRYSSHSEEGPTTANQLFAIVFRTPVALASKDTVDALHCSYYLNSLSLPQLQETAELVPHGSLALLSALPGAWLEFAMQRAPSDAQAIAAAAAITRAGLGTAPRTPGQILDALTHNVCIPPDRETLIATASHVRAHPLAWSLQWWLELRLAALADHELKPRWDSFSLLELLGLKKFSAELKSHSLQPFKNFKFGTRRPFLSAKPLQQSIRGFSGIDALIDEVADRERHNYKLHGSFARPHFISPRQGDPFDLLLVLRDNSIPYQWPPFLVFLSCGPGARAPAATDRDGKRASTFSPDEALEVMRLLAAYRQQQHAQLKASAGADAGAGGGGQLQAAVGKAAADVAGDRDVDDPIAGDVNDDEFDEDAFDEQRKREQIRLLRAAIVAGHYAYVYVRTEAGQTRVPDLPEDYPVVDMCRDSTEGFFGPFWDLREAVRSAYEDGEFAADARSSSNSSAPGPSPADDHE